MISGDQQGRWHDRTPAPMAGRQTGWLPGPMSARQRLQTRRTAVFLAAGGVLAYLAFEGAGYDIVVRQAVALGAWAAVAAGLILGAFPRGHLSRWLLVPAGAALALVAWMLLSLGWTPSDERTVAEIARVLGYAGLMTLALLGLNKHTFKAAAAGVATAAFAVVGVAVLSRLAPSMFPDALDVAGRFTRSDRLTFPLDYWNAVGAWGAMTVAVGIAWSAHARHRRSSAYCYSPPCRWPASPSTSRTREAA